MQRKTVNVWVEATGFCKTKVKTITAYCHKCAYFEPCEDSADKGHCFYFPNTVVKERADWCSQFRAEEGL